MSDFVKIRSFIDGSNKSLIELQTLLCAIPALAPENGGDGELQKCVALENWLKQHGFTQFERFDAPDSRVSGGIRPNLLVTVAGKQARAVWIMSHMDIVPPGEATLWNSDPYKVVEKDGKLFGRGVEDNQHGLCASVFAAYAFLKNGIVPEYTIKLLFCADEEVGSAYGIQYLLKNHSLFKKDDLIIIPDSGDEQGASIEVAEKNLMWLRITTLGKQTHGSRPDQGANAHLANCELALLLNKLEEDFTERDSLFAPDRSTFQPTKKEANVPNINTIPGEDVFCMDCRILPCYTLEKARAAIRSCITIVEKKYGVKVEYTEEQAVESPATPQNAPVVQLLSAAIERVYGAKAHPVGIGGGTVASYLRNAGLQACVWARIHETAHQPNEYTVLENLLGDAAVLASVMYANK